MSTGSRSSGRRIVLVVHAMPPEEHSGATLTAQGYARELARRGWDVTVLHGADTPDPGWTLARPSRHRRPSEDFFCVPSPRLPWTGAQWARRAPGFAADPGRNRIDAAFLALLTELQPDVVHVVDNVDLPLSFPELAAALGVGVVRTVTCAEDLCGLIAPVSPCASTHGYCAPPLTPAHCAGCIQAAARATPGPCRPPRPGPGPRGEAPTTADRWRRDELLAQLTTKRERARHQYRHVYSKVVFASPRFRDYFAETLPLDPHRVAVVPMGTEAVHVPPGDPRDRTSGPVRFVMAATGHAAKGIDAVVDAFSSPELLARRDRWRLQLLGHPDAAPVEPLASSPSVRVAGPYHPGDLGRLLSGADVGISASVFETFHRVTREYLSAGLAVLGSTAFGITDAVVDGVNGLLFEHSEPGSLCRGVLRLLEEPGLVETLRAGARATPLRTVADEVGDLEALYATLLRP